jgi:uncharacterized membrane protein (DUF4010 family)
MTPDLTVEQLALTLGLSFFYGLAYEEFYAKNQIKPPGGVRTFPLLALLGLGLYLVEPLYASAFSAGLLGLSAWLHAYYQARWGRELSTREAGAGLISPASNLLVYLLGPVVMHQPFWVPVGLTVFGVLLISVRERLHRFARNIPSEEIFTLAKFLVLTGIILPILPNHPVTTLSAITPYQVWLAVVVVSSLSYGSYLVQRYVSPGRGVLVAALLGGLYSSTATTVVLARFRQEDRNAQRRIQAAIILASSLMYLRVAIVVAVFNMPLALSLAPLLLGLFFFGLLLSAACYFRGRGTGPGGMALAPINPLELNAALVFAGLFIVISLASAWVKTEFGQAGIYWLAAAVGIADVDPFVLSLAQGGGGDLGMGVTVSAVLVALSSNNLLKAGYSIGFAGVRSGILAAVALALLGSVGIGIAVWGM